MKRFESQHNDTRKNRRKWLIFLGVLSLILSYSIFFFFPSPLPVAPPESQLQVIEGSLKERSTLYESFIEKKIPLQWMNLITSKLSPYVDFNRIQGGTYRFMMDMKGGFRKFVFKKSPIEVYEIEKTPEGYLVQKKKILLENYLVKVEGEIHSSLFEAMNAIGEKDSLTLSFAEILAWEIDFYKDVKEGDRFKVVVEKIYQGDQFIQYGTIHAVEFQRGERIIRGIRYREDYYDEKGSSLRRAFLKAPLRFNRISSRFCQRRRHPILGGVQPHLGVDYAAPIGTPVWAVADGTVISMGWARGYGKQVVLRHISGYKTYYGHLSRYGPGIKIGKHAQQKEIIGYVGSTGLSTGPHLDYRLSKDRRFRNPLKETFPEGYPIGELDRDEFNKRRDEMVVLLADENPYRKRQEDMTTDTIPKDENKSYPKEKESYLWGVFD